MNSKEFDSEFLFSSYSLERDPYIFIKHLFSEELSVFPYQSLQNSIS